MKELFQFLRENRHEEAKAWKKETGKKVIGLFCCNVPEEIIFAAGMLPVRILGEHEEATEGNLHFPVNVCPYPKSCLDLALKGNYDYLDGLVVPNVCDMIRAMYGTWKLNTDIPFVYFLEAPQRISPEGEQFFHNELIRFASALEELADSKITDEDLKIAIDVYNQNRSLLMKAYDFRKEGRMSGVLLQSIVLSSMLVSKDKHNQVLSEYLQEVESRNLEMDNVKLFISSSMLDDTDFVQLIEDCGGIIVADDMPTGSRYFFYPVNNDEEPLKALANRYLSKIPCPRKMLPEARYEFIDETLSGSDAKGAIIHNLKACDCHLYEYPFLKERLESKGIPVLFFRGEETEAEMETQRDDIEAFIEMLR